MRDILLLNISGADHPGVSAEFTETLARHAVNILDIGQAVIHDRLNLGMLIEVPDAAESGAVMKELLFLAHQHKLNVDFNPIDEDDYENWVASQGRPRFIVTLLGRKLSAANISHVAAVVSRHGLNIDAITRLSGRFSLREHNPRRTRLRRVFDPRRCRRSRAACATICSPSPATTRSTSPSRPTTCTAATVA